MDPPQPFTSRFSTTAATALFAPGESPEAFADGQFVVCRRAVLCFVTAGPNAGDSHLSSPSRLVYRPPPSATDDDWLPAPVTDVWDRSTRPVRKVREHHLLLRSRLEREYLYCGTAHLGSWGTGRGSTGRVTRSAHFSLTAKLPRHVWLDLGGYPGWSVEIDHEVHRVDAGDLRTFDTLVGRSAGREFAHVSLTRYEGDRLEVFTNGSRGWLMYCRDPDDGGEHARGSADDDRADGRERFRCVCGEGLDFPAADTVRRVAAVAAAAEFFRTGTRPRTVDWRRD